MQTLREAPFAQLIRLVATRYFRSPEEQDLTPYQRYMSPSPTDQPPQEMDRPPTQHRISGTSLRALQSYTDSRIEEEGYGLLTLTSQVTRARTRTSINTDAGAQDGQLSLAEKKFSKSIDGQVRIVGWSSPQDEDNPQNWSRLKKILVSAQICYMTFSVYIGAGIYSASIEGVSDSCHVSPVAAVLGLTGFVAGYGLGPMVWAPLTEAPSIGRNIVYVGTLLVFVCFNLCVVLADNFGMLLAFRFLTGFIGSSALAVGGGSMADMWHPSVLSYAMAVWGATAVCGPTLGPLLGGFAIQGTGHWNWSIWIVMLTSGLSLALSLFLLPETSAPTILFRRAARIRKLTKSQRYRSASELEAMSTPKKALLYEALVRPFQLCFTEPVVQVLNIYIAPIYGILYLFFEAYPIVFGGIYGFDLQQNGLAWLGNFTGALLGMTLMCAWIYFAREKKQPTPHGLPPEAHLPPAIAAGVAITVSLLWFAWVSRSSIHWIVPLLATACLVREAPRLCVIR